MSRRGGAGSRPAQRRRRSFYFQSAVKILNSYLSLASRSEQNTSRFPSGENSGNEVNPPKSVTCSNPLPSTFIWNNSNLRLSHSFLLDANTIFLPSGVKVGAKLAQPKSVMVRAPEPSA